MDVISYVILSLYIVLILLALINGWKTITKQVKSLMIVGECILLVSLVGLIISINLFTLSTLIIGLVSIQITAIMNGLAINKKINFTHQFIRFIIGVIIVLLLIL